DFSMKAAHVYAREYGWRVVPLHSLRPDGGCSCGHVQPSREAFCECGVVKCPKAHLPGSTAKHPRVKDWAEAASCDAATVQDWQARWPDANTGVATGSASGFFVLDVDPENGGDATLNTVL